MSDGYQVARCDDTVYVRARGMANMKNAAVLDTFLREEAATGVNTVCIDLDACTGMDSTFMGTLVGYHHRLGDRGGRLVIVNAAPEHRRLLDMLGVSTVLPVVSEPERPDLSFFDLAATRGISPMERAAMMKEAHEHLVRLSEANRAKFASFLQALEKDLQRQQRESGEAE